MLDTKVSTFLTLEHTPSWAPQSNEWKLMDHKFLTAFPANETKHLLSSLATPISSFLCCENNNYCSFYLYLHHLSYSFDLYILWTQIHWILQTLHISPSCATYLFVWFMMLFTKTVFLFEVLKFFILDGSVFLTC